MTKELESQAQESMITLSCGIEVQDFVHVGDTPAAGAEWHVFASFCM